VLPVGPERLLPAEGPPRSWASWAAWRPREVRQSLPIEG